MVKKMAYELNEEKNEICLFTKTNVKTPNNRQPVVKLDNKDIQYNPNPRIMGFHLNEQLIFQHHIKTTQVKALKAVSRISQLKKMENIKTEKLLQLYQALVIPIMDYASPIWQIADCKLLEEVQRK